MGPFATLLLTMAVEALKLAGDVKAAKKVGEILKSRPNLSEAESLMFKRATERLGRNPR